MLQRIASALLLIGSSVLATPTLTGFNIVCGKHDISIPVIGEMQGRTAMQFTKSKEGEKVFDFMVNGDMHVPVCSNNAYVGDIQDDGSIIYSLPEENRNACVKKELEGVYAGVDIFFKWDPSGDLILQVRGRGVLTLIGGSFDVALNHENCKALYPNMYDTAYVRPTKPPIFNILKDEELPEQLFVDEQDEDFEEQDEL